MGVFGAVSYLPCIFKESLTHGIGHRNGALLSLGWTAGSLLAGQWFNRMGYRIVSVVGMLLLALGYGLCIFPTNRVGVFVVLISGIAIGIGMGLANLTALVAAQNAVWFRRIGVATSTVMLFRTFGSAFVVSLMGTVMLNQMQLGLNRLANGGMDGLSLSPALLAKLAHPQNLLEPAMQKR
jgi:MFS family permease